MHNKDKWSAHCTVLWRVRNITSVFCRNKSFLFFVSQKREQQKWESCMLAINGVKEDKFLQAATEHNMRKLKLMLTLGENVDHTDNMQRTALMQAVKEGQKGCVEYLLVKKCDVNKRNCQGYTALHFAIRENRVGFVKMLLDSGCDVNLPTYTGITPLMEAVR